MRAVVSYFQHLLAHAFDIREGEQRRAVLMQLNIFLIISALLIVKPAVNGLFLSRFGAESLPFAFMLVALFAGLVSLLYTRILVKLPLNIIITRTIGWSVATLSLFGLLLRLDFLEGWVLYLFYVWVAIFAVLSASQFWVLANVVFNPREAKRLFGFIGAGAIAGGIFGGYLTSVTAEWIGSENLLFIAALLLVLCIPITRTIWRKEVVPSQPQFVRRKRIRDMGDNPWTLIRRSKHLTYLAAIIGISVIVAKLVEYQFSDIASARIPDPDDLTAFFGFWFSNFNVISLVLQLFITRKVVGVFGVGTSLFFLPAGILVGAVLVFIFPELWAVIVIKLMDGSLKQSVNKSAIELMALPIPLEIKNQTKSFIDIFIDSAATGIGGLILVFLVSGFDLSTRSISFMIVAFLILWIYFARKIREEYIRSFKLKVEQVHDHPDRKPLAFDLSSESVLNGLRKVLRTGTERQRVFILRKVRENPDERLFHDISALLDNPAPEVRSEALQCLYYFRTTEPEARVLGMVSDPDQGVKTAAFGYLIARVPRKRSAYMEQFLRDRDYRVRGAALVSLAVEARNNAEMRNRFDLETRIIRKIETLAQLTDADEIRFRKQVLLKAIGHAALQGQYWFISDMFDDEDPEVVKQAIESAGHSLNPEFIRTLSGFLGREPYRQAAKMSLMGFGTALIDHFQEVVARNAWATDLLRQIPGILEHFESQQSVDLLFLLLDHQDIGLRMEALRSLNVLRKRNAGLRFHKKDVARRIFEEARLYQETLTALYFQMKAAGADRPVSGSPEERRAHARLNLTDLLERRLDGNLERIFWLLGLRYPGEDMHSIFQGIQSKMPDIRVNAVEFLDNLLESNLKRILIPIVETALLDNISDAAIRNMNLKVPDEYQCLMMLLAGKDVKVSLAVLHLIAQLGNKHYIPLVSNYTGSGNAKIRASARQTLHELLTS